MCLSFQTQSPATFSTSFVSIKMPLKDSFVIWNNKGGVGKTTLTFHLATHYAMRNPDRKVLVIDLCPQANVSMALLGSSGPPGSQQNATTLFAEKKTISYYLQKVTKPLSKIDPQDFLTHVSDYNDQIPENIELLCGDMQLELVSRSLEHKRQDDPVPDYNPWYFITSCVRFFIEGSDGLRGVTADRVKEWVVFIDTNPSFSPYTEIALAAANKLIIPINADDFSREAIKAMLDLVYGIAGEEIPPDFREYRTRMFHFKAEAYALRRPKIHLVINNRTTRYSLRSATAFQDMADSNIEVLFQAYQKKKECFVRPRQNTARFDILGFAGQYFEDLQDFHTTGILALHTGCPLATLRGKVQLFYTDVEVKRAQVEAYLLHLERLVLKL